jgi:hypothetical protein
VKYRSSITIRVCRTALNLERANPARTLVIRLPNEASRVTPRELVKYVPKLAKPSSLRYPPKLMLDGQYRRGKVYISFGLLREVTKIQ